MSRCRGNTTDSCSDILGFSDEAHADIISSYDRGSNVAHFCDKRQSDDLASAALIHTELQALLAPVRRSVLHFDFFSIFYSVWWSSMLKELRESQSGRFAPWDVEWRTFSAVIPPAAMTLTESVNLFQSLSMTYTSEDDGPSGDTHLHESE